MSFEQSSTMYLGGSVVVALVFIGLFIWRWNQQKKLIGYSPSKDWMLWAFGVLAAVALGGALYFGMKGRRRSFGLQPVRLIDFDYTWCSEVSRGKGRNRLTPNEQRDVELLLLMQYVLMLAQYNIQVGKEEFLQKVFTQFGYPRTPQDIAALYRSTVDREPVPHLRQMLNHYNPLTFGSLSQFKHRLISLMKGELVNAPTTPNTYSV